ncbi:MAG: phytoene dehydrogenase, partial [Planctomycetaceae bacterium]|nr:phytoene dehydrogenase [Planctomycetaceae bacterium]
ICVPGNYAHEVPLDRHLLRATHLANHEVWFEWPEERYQAEKSAWIERSRAVVGGLGADFSGHVRYTDGFTPRTVTRFTGHRNGAVYGAPKKLKTGQTEVANLFLCGTDQGFVGIVGAMLSGIAMANAHGMSAGGAA